MAQDNATAVMPNRYVMAIDPGGRDDKTYSICVLDNMSKAIAYIITVHDKAWYEKEVERLKLYYNIDKPKIVRDDD